jgi:hypothetical protein
MTWKWPISRPKAVRSSAYCERAVERRWAPGDAARRADQPLALELPHDVVEALADLAEHGAVGHAHVLEGQQRRVGACMPSFSSFFSRITPGRSMSTEEQREAVVGPRRGRSSSPAR